MENAHHDFFDVWSAKLRDLKEFGTGHLLYFHFLQVIRVCWGEAGVAPGRVGAPSCMCLHKSRAASLCRLSIHCAASLVG